MECRTDSALPTCRLHSTHWRVRPWRIIASIPLACGTPNFAKPQEDTCRPCGRITETRAQGHGEGSGTRSPANWLPLHRGACITIGGLIKAVVVGRGLHTESTNHSVRE